MPQTDYVVRMRGDSAELSRSIANVKNALKETGVAGSKLDDIKKSFEKIQSSSAPLSRRIRDLKREMENLALSEDMNTKEGVEMWEKLRKAAQDYDGTLQDIQKSAKAVRVPDAKSKIDFKSIGGAIGDKLGLGGLGAQAAGALANPYVVAAGAIAGAGKALYDYNVELERSLQKTAQFTGLSGDGLISLRNGIKSVADTFGKDYDTVLSSVDGLMAQFKIDGEEALRIIRDGFVGGADEGGRMLEMISQYGGAFKDAGISASELVAIIGNTRSGIFSEEGMQLIQIAAKNIRTLSKSASESLDAIGISSEQMKADLQSGAISTMEALQMISERLKDLPPQSRETGEVLQDVFGKKGSKAGLELVTALADVETSLEKVKNQSGEWGEAMERLQQADREMENALSSLFGIADGGFSTMTTRLKADVYSAVAKVINGFIDLYNQSIVVRGAIQGIALQFKISWEIVKAILRLFMNALKSLGEIIEGIFNLDWDAVKEAWTSGAQNLLQNISTLFAGLGENAAEAVNSTLNGKINRIEVPVDLDYSDVEIPEVEDSYIEGGETKGGKNKGSKEKEIAEAGSVKALEDRVVEINKLLSTMNLSPEVVDSLNAEKKSIEDQIKALKIRNGLLEGPEDGSLQALKSRMTEIDKELTSKVNSDESRAKLLEEKKAIREIIKEEEKKLKSLDYEEGSLDDLRARYSELQKELNSTNVSNERLEQIREESKALADEIELATRRNESATVPESDFKRKRHSEISSQIEQLRGDVKLGIVGADEAMEKIRELNAELEGLGLKPIDIRVNSSGNLEDLEERLASSREKMEMTAGAVSNLGGAMSTLGGSIEGAGGEWLAFTGKTIQSIAQLIPQIMTMIGAYEAEATAGAAAAGSGVAFPGNIAAIAAGVAAVAGIFASLPKFAEGGIVPGGSRIGDNLLVRANSGEMILNQRQQNNLYNAIRNNELGWPATPGGGVVRFRISGSELVGVLDNYNSKVRRQS